MATVGDATGLAVGCNRKDKHEEQIAGLMRTARGSCQKLKEMVIDLETTKRSEDGWVTEATYPKTMYDLMHSLRAAIIRVVKLRKMTCWPRCEDGGSVAKTLNRRVEQALERGLLVHVERDNDCQTYIPVKLEMACKQSLHIQKPRE